jgi:hypothetical protein
LTRRGSPYCGAAEIGLALAIVLMVFRTHGHIEVDELRALADRDEAEVRR